MPPERSSRRPCSTYSAYSTLSASTNTRSYAPSLSFGSTLRAAPLISRKRWVGMPIARNDLRAVCWCSGSMSTLVENAVGLHAGEQRQAGDARTGADLDDGPGLDRPRQHGERGSRAAAQRRDAERLGVLAGRGRVSPTR